MSLFTMTEHPITLVMVTWILLNCYLALRSAPSSSLYFSPLQIKTKRRSQQRGGAQPPVVLGNSSDVTAAPVAVADTAGYLKTDRWGQRLNSENQRRRITCLHSCMSALSSGVCFALFTVLGFILHTWMATCGPPNVNSSMSLQVVCFLNSTFVYCIQRVGAIKWTSVQRAASKYSRLPVYFLFLQGSCNHCFKIISEQLNLTPHCPFYIDLLYIEYLNQ